MTKLNNPMAQLARMYKLLEESLRHHPFRMVELTRVPELAEETKSPWQIRDLVHTLVSKGFLIKKGERQNTTYEWNTEAPPFVLQVRQFKKVATAPSEPEVTTFTETRQRTVTAVATKEVELVLGEYLVILGKNPSTGRLRITIEDAH